jgi:hypothetical protein
MAGAVPGGQTEHGRPAPLTVVVQQLSGRDPLVERPAKPHIDRVEYPSLRANDDFKDALKARVADELRALEERKSITPETGANADGTTLSADSTLS